jgi:hypothetical protein
MVRGQAKERERGARKVCVCVWGGSEREREREKGYNRWPKASASTPFVTLFKKAYRRSPLPSPSTCRTIVVASQGSASVTNRAKMSNCCIFSYILPCNSPPFVLHYIVVIPHPYQTRLPCRRYGQLNRNAGRCLCKDRRGSFTAQCAARTVWGLP